MCRTGFYKKAGGNCKFFLHSMGMNKGDAQENTWIFFFFFFDISGKYLDMLTWKTYKGRKLG